MRLIGTLTLWIRMRKFRKIIEDNGRKYLSVPFDYLPLPKKGEDSYVVCLDKDSACEYVKEIVKMGITDIKIERMPLSLNILVRFK